MSDKTLEELRDELHPSDLVQAIAERIGDRATDPTAIAHEVVDEIGVWLRNSHPSGSGLELADQYGWATRYAFYLLNGGAPQKEKPA